MRDQRNSICLRINADCASTAIGGEQKELFATDKPQYALISTGVFDMIDTIYWVKSCRTDVREALITADLSCTTCASCRKSPAEGS